MAVNFHALAYGAPWERARAVRQMDDHYTDALRTIREKRDDGTALERVSSKFEDTDNTTDLVEAVACNADDHTIAELVRSQVKRAASWIDEEREEESR